MKIFKRLTILFFVGLVCLWGCGRSSSCWAVEYPREASSPQFTLQAAAKGESSRYQQILQDFQSTDDLVVNGALWQINPTFAEAVPTFRALLKSRSPNIIQHGIKALMMVGRASKDAVPDLIRLLTYQHMLVRSSAMEAISRIDPTPKKTLLDHLDNMSPELRKETLDLLGPAAEGPAIILSMLTVPGSRDEALKHAYLLGEELTPEHFKAVADLFADPAIRQSCIWYLERYGPPIVPFVAPYLANSDPEVRLVAAQALSHMPIGDTFEAVTALIPLLKEKEPKILQSAMTALGRAGGHAVSHLITYLRVDQPVNGGRNSPPSGRPISPLLN